MESINKMGNFWGPIQGFLIGVLLIVYRHNATAYVQKAFTKFPKYEDGANSLKYQYSVKPLYIVILGIIFIVIAVGGFISILFP